MPELCGPTRGVGLAQRRFLCHQAPKPSGPERVPKGFGNFFKQRPGQGGSGQAAEGSAKEGKAPGAGSSGAAESGAKEASPVEGAAASGSRGGNGGTTAKGGDGGAKGSNGGAKGGDGGAKGSAGGGKFGAKGSDGGSKGGSSRKAPAEDGGEGGPMTTQHLAMAALTSVVLALQFYPRGPDPSEITFTEFRRELLESGSVQRIVITNKTKAIVHMRSAGAGQGQGQGHYWISLGNVNGFEKKLEQAQEDIGVAPRDYLPVTYESETSLVAEALKNAPTLLLIVFWAYMLRSGISGMGGMGGGGGGEGADNEALYAELGLSRGAAPSAAEVTKAYRRMAVRCHPDKGGDPETFKRISEAYSVLSDPEKRKLCVFGSID